MDTLVTPHRVRARKNYRCDYCNKAILIGEEYTRATYKSDFCYDWKSCDRCEPYVQEALSNEGYDWSDGMSEQDFMNYMWEERREVAKSWWS